jgi:EAL domain-containing protein (putative c-di-GMP-specific phosphodiesterase class I)/GGDEF domain-containing protein
MFKRFSTELVLIYAALFGAALLVDYMLTANLSQDHDMLGAILLIGLIGFIALIAGSWFVSGRVTGSISDLHAAALRLAQGEHTDIKVKGRNEIAGLASSFNIMSGEIAAREKRILQLALHDRETGLPNLRGIETRLDAMRVGHHPATLFGAVLGIDRFSQLRGVIGHAPSARLIAEIAERISAAYSELFVGRMTTETIAVVFRAESHEAAMGTVAAIAKLASQPVRLGDDRIDTCVTVGLSCDADDTDTRLSLLERAEVAVEQGRARRQHTMSFDRAAHGDPSGALALMGSMVLGLSRDEFFLAHQPKFDLRQGRICSAESLLRWRHPTQGVISPHRFIGMAEETGHIRPITDWVIDRAIADQRKLREAGRDVVLSVSVPGRLIADAQFAERTLRQVRRSGARLSLAITEAAVLDNPGVALEIMKDMRDAGIGIAIDAYGSGPSSISCLRTIPAQELQIDSLVIQNMARGNADALLVKSITDLAHSLGMSVTAKGVETAETLALLQATGADAAQGGHIAHPMPLDDFLKFDVAPQTARPPATLKGLA